MPLIPLHHFLMLVAGAVLAFLGVTALLVQLCCRLLKAEEIPSFPRALLGNVIGIGIVVLVNGAIMAVAQLLGGTSSETDTVFRVVVSVFQFAADVVVFAALYRLMFNKLSFRKGLVMGLVVASALLGAVLAAREAAAAVKSGSERTKGVIRGE